MIDGRPNSKYVCLQSAVNRIESALYELGMNRSEQSACKKHRIRKQDERSSLRLDQGLNHCSGTLVVACAVVEVASSWPILWRNMHAKPASLLVVVADLSLSPQLLPSPVAKPFVIQWSRHS